MIAPRIRCAIYTRKSTEEGLEQAFNSLDAQALPLLRMREGAKAGMGFLPDEVGPGSRD